MREKKEKNALVFGGSSDIGQAIVSELAKDYNVLFTYYRNRETAKQLSGKHLRCDVRKLRQIQRVFSRVPELSLNLIVTAAFPYIRSECLEFTGYKWVEPYLCGHVLIHDFGALKLIRGGKIINLLGQCVDHGLSDAPHYSAAFAFLENLAMSINVSYGRGGCFSVHNLLLGPVETKLWQNVPEEVVAAIRDRAIFLKPVQVAKEVRHIAENPIGPTKLVLDGFRSLP